MIKKQFISILLSLFSLITYSQTFDVYINGIVYDEITNFPVSYQEIEIEAYNTDSTFTYRNTVTTNFAGEYYDIITAPTGTQGVAKVSTISCGLVVTQFFEFAQNTPQIQYDIYICTNPSGNSCEALFTYYTENPMEIQFQDLSTGDSLAWYWDFDDGNTSDEQNPLHSYNQTGDYYVTLEISNDSCLSSFELLVRVTNDTSYCTAEFIYENGTTPLSINFTDISTGDITSWQWDFGDGNYSTQQNPTHFYEAQGEYFVSLFIEGNDYCFDYYEELIIVQNDTNICNAMFNVKLDTINNIPHTYIFTDESEGDITSWYWSFGDNSFSNEQNPIHTYANGGNYSVYLTIESLFGFETCSSTYCYEISTIEYYNFGGQAFIGDYPININAGEDDNIATAYLYRKINNVWQYMDKREFWEYGYYWFVEKPVGEYLIQTQLNENSLDYDNYAPAYINNAISWKNAGAFVLSNNEQFAVNITLRELAASPLGTGSISGTIIGDQSCDTNYNIVTNNVLIQLFDNQNQLIAYTYSNEYSEYEFTGLTFTNYYIKPEYTGRYTEITNITLSDASHNQNDINLTINCSHTLDIQEYESDYFKLIADVYPNPVTANAHLNLQLIKQSNIKVSIVNQFGQTVFTNSLFLPSGNQIIELPTQSLTQGLYFVKITGDDNVSVVRKFIKTKR